MLENPDFPTSDYFRRFPCLSGHDGLKYVGRITIFMTGKTGLQVKLNRLAYIWMMAYITGSSKKVFYWLNAPPIGDLEPRVGVSAGIE
jgi:hypothetical protein